MRCQAALLELNLHQRQGCWLWVVAKPNSNRIIPCSLLSREEMFLALALIVHKLYCQADPPGLISLLLCLSVHI